ncbi:MAG: serine/threonine-protein kinase [Acidobacteriota bacterium]|nr:serine/threonine-protein kinase [Acidobacteriota bacterium]
MAVATGTRLGPYEVLAPIGAGGMGEVYRARDTRLAREVAIKVVPPELAQRFEREARAISQLNHPNICTLYDVGENYLVMELLEGESLADRLAKGPLPLDQVLRYGVQIADALDKAHRTGIIHRDLKPGNIMITKSGAKLLDFGLAKSGAAPAPTEATMQKPLTAEGTIIGTFQYMAPEQLEGQQADARTDIFAFGTVLYEMATGKRAFEGKTRTSLIAAIVSGEPKPMTQLQPLAPLAFENVVRKCIAKNPDDRWQCAADLQWELRRIQESPDVKGPARMSRVPWGIAAAAIAAAAILAALAFRPAKPQRPIRFTVTAPLGWTFSLNYNIGPPAVSPDGRYMAFPASEDATGRVLLWVRDLSAPEPFSLPGTEGAGFPFWSPDSRSIAFFGGGYLKRVEVSGGAPQALCPVAFGRGGSWSQANEIIFAPTGNSPLFRVSAAGGTPQQVTKLDAARSEVSNRWPLFLPDGKHFLYLIRKPSMSAAVSETINVASLDSPVPRAVMSASSNVVYVDSGYLLYMRDRTLMRQRFNLRALELEGQPQVITTEAMQFHASGFGLFSASRNAVLAYGAGTPSGTLQWLDRGGHAQPVAATADYYLGPRLSRDDQQVLYGLPDAVSGTLDLWLFDIGRRVSRRITFDPRDDFVGVLTPDATHVIFSSNRGGFPSLFMKSVDGSDEVALTEEFASVPEFAEDISPDGRILLFRRISAQRQNDIFAMELSGKTIVPLLTSPFNETQPVFSPTGRWIAYVSNESGRYQVYVMRYPAGGPRVQITADGGSQPTWRGDEKELFFLAPGGRMMSVSIDTTGGVLKPGVPAHLFDASIRPSRDEEREYDVTRDGQRFIINSVPPNIRSIPITVVVNWQNDLEHK